MKKIAVLIFTLVIGFVFLALPALAQPPKKITLRFGNVYAPDHPFNTGFRELSKTLMDKSGGRLEIQVFPASQLGNENDLADSIAQNIVDMGIIGCGVLGLRHAPVFVFDAPYVFRDMDHATRVARGEMGRRLFSELEKKAKLRVLDVMYYGTRVTTTSKKEVNTVADLKGLKMRVPNQPISLAIMRSWGASPTPMAFAEVYLALQQGVVDGQENPMVAIMTMKFNEVQRFLILTWHQLQTTPVVINADRFASLPADLQKLLVDELRIAADRISRIVRADELKYIEDIRASGQMKVISPDLESFRKASLAAVEENKSRWGDRIYDEIQAIR